MSARNWGGWERLICPYFAATCRRVLGRYFEESGFTEKGLNEVDGLIFVRFGVFVEVSYELETAPNYAISMVLGLGGKKYDQNGNPCGVPYWFLLPPDRAEHRGKMINFRSQTALIALLEHFRDQFLEPYAKPLWADVDRLEKAIQDFRIDCNNRARR
jgi:hypothetical protein